MDLIILLIVLLLLFGGGGGGGLYWGMGAGATDSKKWRGRASWQEDARR